MTTINLTEATIAKLDLQPDDVIVLRITDSSYRPSAPDVEEMKSRLRAILGESQKIIVLAYGLDLEVAHRSEVPV